MYNSEQKQTFLNTITNDNSYRSFQRVFKAVQDMEEKETMVTELYQQGVSTDRILDIYVKKYWKQLDSADVPFEAFRMNSGWEVKAILKTLKEVPAS